MLKKSVVILCGLLLAGCSVWRGFSGHTPSYEYAKGTVSEPLSVTGMTDYSQVDLGNAESFRVAMLLPLSGQMAGIGKSMKNAATMAIGDLNNNHLVIQFYDTKSNASGARVAVENAINAGSSLILGPLLSDEVAAIAGESKSKDIPVISFSTSPSILESGVYSLGLLNEEQINRIVRYAVSQGRRRLAAVLPDNQSGLNMFKSLMKVTRSAGMNLVKVGFYNPNSMDFTSLVTSMTAHSAQAEGGGKSFGFDALLIPESGNRLKAISSMFSYYDVAAPQVLFMGTSVWANSNLSKETELYGAVYPVMSLNRLRNFEQKYVDLFGERPSGLDIFAYDAVALASALSHKDSRSLEEHILRMDGYYGMSGAFRIFADGRNEHGLDVVRITPDGEQVVEAAPSKFYTIQADYVQGQTDISGSSYSNYYDMPQIYGKSAADLQNMLR
ncbi:MAG: penicillin-binding protein activator [Alphaproteobacteria bacterium]|nr:penicillin-binding protein activator [Alphaproteobacteria bacterium]